MVYEPRFYRYGMGRNRFKAFKLLYKETDVWVGVDPDSYRDEMVEFLRDEIIRLRKILETYISSHPEFHDSLKPVKPRGDVPQIIKEMCEAGEKAGVGPMAAVAGAFAQHLGTKILEKFEVKELIVENGGDIFLKLMRSAVIAIFAGQSPFSGKVGLEIPPEDTPCGVCTSSATVGPSLSLGNADAVTVVCRKASLADAFATAYCNRIKSKNDIERIIAEVQNTPGVLTLVAMLNDVMGVWGKHHLKILKHAG